MKVAASPQSINRAMPEGGIQVTSHQSLEAPNPCFHTCVVYRTARKISRFARNDDTRTSDAS